MLLRAFAIALVAMCPFLASQTAPQLAQPAPQVGQPAPDFSLNDSAGSPVKLSAYKGRVVLLDFWATWCAGCKVEIPWYMEFQDKYRNDGLAAIGVSMDDDGWKSVKPFLDEHKLNYPSPPMSMPPAAPPPVSSVSRRSWLSPLNWPS